MQKDRISRLTKKQQYWLEQIKLAQASDQPLSTYAKAHDLDPQQFYQYQHVLRKKGVIAGSEQKPGFQKVELQPFPDHQRANPGMLNLHFPNGLRLEFSTTISSDVISTLVQQMIRCDVTS